VLGRRRTPDKNNVRQSRLPEKRTANKEFFSYHASRQPALGGTAQTRQPREKLATVSKIRLRHLPTIIAFIALITSLFYMTTLGSDVRIQSATTSKLLRDQSVYQIASAEILSSSVLNKNKVTIDTTKFEESMTQRFPELVSVSMTLPIVGHKPIVSLNADKPVLYIASQRGVFIVNKNGKALAKVSETEKGQGLDLPTLQDDANLPIELGKGVLSTQDVTFITTLVSQLNEKKVTISSLTLPPLAAELQVRPEGLKYYVRFSLLTNPRIAAGQYLATKKKLEVEKVTPKEYIDARVEEKIFFK